MTTATTHFGPATWAFLDRLAAGNSKATFEAERDTHRRPGSVSPRRRPGGWAPGS